MFDYYIDILNHKDLNYVPKKLPIPNVGVNVLSTKAEWEQVLKTGNGSIKLAPKMSMDKEGVITIDALPESKSIEHVRKIIEKEILLDKIDLRDESTYTTRIVIEKVYKKQCDMKEIYRRLYKKLQTSITYNMAFFDRDHMFTAVPSFQITICRTACRKNGWGGKGRGSVEKGQRGQSGEFPRRYLTKHVLAVIIMK